MNGLVVWDDFICSAESLELKKKSMRGREAQRLNWRQIRNRAFNSKFALMLVWYGLA